MKNLYGGKLVGKFIPQDIWHKDAFQRGDPWDVKPQRVELTKQDKDGLRAFVVIVLDIFLLVMWFMALKKNHWNLLSYDVLTWSFILAIVSFVDVLLRKSSHGDKK